MRIVQVSPYRLEEEAGSLKAAHELAKRLSQKHQVLFVCFGDKSELEKVTKDITYLRTPSLKVSHLTTPSFPGFYAVKIRKTLSEFKPDIVHIQLGREIGSQPIFRGEMLLQALLFLMLRL